MSKLAVLVEYKLNENFKVQTLLLGLVCTSLKKNKAWKVTGKL